MDFVAIRKIIAGIIFLLLASGVIKVDFISKHKWIRVLCYVLGAFLLISSILYQFNIIPESSTDAFFKQRK